MDKTNLKNLKMKKQIKWRRQRGVEQGVRNLYCENLI